MRSPLDWDWAATAKEFGVGDDGSFNAGDVGLEQQRALVWRRTDGSTVRFSGPEARAEVERISASLAALGIGRGDRVAAVLGRRPEALLLPLAVWRLEAIYVPLFSGFGLDALRVRLADSGTCLVIADAANEGDVGRAIEGLEGVRDAGIDPGTEAEIDFAEVSAEEPAVPAAARTALDTPATIMYTSGTTGRPKGCVLGHKAVVSLAPFVRACLALEQDEILFSTADTGWSFGLLTTGLAPVLMGSCRLLYEGGFDAHEWLRVAQEEEATHIAGAPTGYRQIAAVGEAALPEGEMVLRRATSAGEALDSEVIGWFERHLGLTIHDAYGLTELGMVTGNLRVPGTPPVAAGSMGVALPGFDIDLLDESGVPLEGEATGRVAIREGTFQFGDGYWGRTPEWEARQIEGRWLTEDIARRDAESRYWHLGRADDIIVTAGYNVSPADIENVIVGHPAVADVACVDTPDSRKGAVIAAHVVLGESMSGSEDELLAELREQVGTRLGWHCAPRHLRLHDELPRTESGKVKRKVLREAGV
jgi:acetyl-CoA synthetase